MGLKSFLDGFTRGRPQQEPPTPYALVPRLAGLGIGVSNYAFQQPYTRPLDSYRGSQGIQVKRNLNSLEGGVYIAKPGTLVVDIVALAGGVNYPPGTIPLIDKGK